MTPWRSRSRRKSERASIERCGSVRLAEAARRIDGAAGWFDCGAQQTFSGPRRLTATSLKQPLSTRHSVWLAEPYPTLSKRCRYKPLSRQRCDGPPTDNNQRHVNTQLPSVGLATSSSHKREIATRARRAAAVISPIHGQAQRARLPCLPARCPDEALLPHRWRQR